MVRPAQVLVIESHEIILSGLVSLIVRDPGLHVLGAVSSLDRGLELFRELRPDVVVLGLQIPIAGSLEVCRQIAQSRPEVGVVLLSVDASDAILRRSLMAGARAFLHVAIGADDLRNAVKAVSRGDAVLDPAVAGRVIDWVRHRPLDRKRSLSRRETEVLRLVSSGASDRRIASDLGLSPNTVKTYLRRSLDKLGCQSRSEAAARIATRGAL